jgi:hypothetical protein
MHPGRSPAESRRQRGRPRPVSRGWNRARHALRRNSEPGWIAK